MKVMIDLFIYGLQYPVRQVHLFAALVEHYLLEKWK